MGAEEVLNEVVDIGMPYFVGQMAKGKASAAEARKPESLAPLIALQSSVFRDDELPKIGRLMGMGRVTKCTLELRIEVTPRVFKNASPSIPGAGISTGEQLIAAINSQLKGLVSSAQEELAWSDHCLAADRPRTCRAQRLAARA